MEFERIIQNSLAKFGILIRKNTTNTNENLRRTALLKTFDVDLIFDIGANTGQYAKNIIDSGYEGHIVSFEPLSTAHKKLKQAQKGLGKWHISEPMAIGKEEGELSINVTQNLVSSSFLSITEKHITGDPNSKIIRQEKVRVEPLEKAGKPFLNLGKRLFIKMDVQGFEQEVLQGAGSLIEKAVGFEMEASIVPLYAERIWLLPEVLEFMTGKGFELKSIGPAFTDALSGEMLQCNAIFFRNV